MDVLQDFAHTFVYQELVSFVHVCVCVSVFGDGGGRLGEKGRTRNVIYHYQHANNTFTAVDM